MRISEKQLVCLLSVLKDSLSFINAPFGIDNKTRSLIYNEIINQQSDEIKDIGELEGRF